MPLASASIHPFTQSPWQIMYPEIASTNGVWLRHFTSVREISDNKYNLHSSALGPGRASPRRSVFQLSFIATC